MINYILKDKEKEKTLKLYLEKIDSDVYLRGIDNEGMDWCIIRFKENGTFYRYEGIKKGTGLQLDDRGKIKEE